MTPSSPASSSHSPTARGHPSECLPLIGPAVSPGMPPLGRSTSERWGHSVTPTSALCQVTAGRSWEKTWPWGIRVPAPCTRIGWRPPATAPTSSTPTSPTSASPSGWTRQVLPGGSRYSAVEKDSTKLRISPGSFLPINPPCTAGTDQPWSERRARLNFPWARSYVGGSSSSSPLPASGSGSRRWPDRSNLP